ncbi:hypothetical protein GH714_024276 [Hevea brasiliensis]|uniref:Protein kinase domain-containing protein n=1 Tax=Hevea brasiliensis TaxID=3981 RepID=A0A6A6N218_HEVBR|nr:hypothetical protein GH714_024276 [Hevea brasiliensis]
MLVINVFDCSPRKIIAKGGVGAFLGGDAVGYGGIEGRLSLGELGFGVLGPRKIIAKGGLGAFLGGNVVGDGGWKERLGLRELNNLGIRVINRGRSVRNNDPGSVQSYADPEDYYPQKDENILQKISEKSDVYSFGVVLLELITGRKNFDEHRVDIVNWGDYIKSEMELMIYCAAASVYRPSKLRPRMKQIVEALEGKMPSNELWVAEEKTGSMAGQKKGSIAFFATYKPPVPLDIFSCPVSPTSRHELHMTDGLSYNYNCQVIPPEALKTIIRRPILASEASEADVDSGRLSGLVFVSERDMNLETLHIALRFTDKVKVLSFADIYGTFSGVRMEDSGGIAGGYKDGNRTIDHCLVYVTTKEPVNDRRQPWTVVYKTNLKTGETKRLTPSEKPPLKRKMVITNGGWPTWGSDDVIFFHRKVGEFWSVFRADISSGELVRVTPDGIDAVTPAAINGTKVAVATIRQKSRFSDHGDDIQRNFHKLHSPHSDVGLFRVSGVFPSFSKDGSKLAFVDNEFKAMWVADSQGLRIVYESKGPDNIFSPVWNQDPQKDTLYVCMGPSFNSSKTLDICAIPMCLAVHGCVESLQEDSIMPSHPPVQTVTN